ncbi:MAG: DUF262 domain-containing protein [Bacteroidales bacterium]
MENNLEKKLTQIFNDQYILPLYQRNFAWGDEEISQLLQDIYESLNKNSERNYYIGSLVVLKRKNGDFEIIDGQQRLTAITLIAKILGLDYAKEPKLFYDSRPEVEAFFHSFYSKGNINNVTFDHKIEHLINAVNLIKEAKLSPSSDEISTIEKLISENGDNLKNFKKYFSEKVILVRVEIPEDTDVANYFEIMNNRGEQLQKHEILKALLIAKIENPEQRKFFAKIWNACSQMNTPIQNLFFVNSITDKENPANNYAGDRPLLFGEKYDQLFVDKIFEIKNIENEEQKKTNINDILNNQNINKTDEEKKSSRFMAESIIDFPNFLMHIFKLLFKDKITSDIPLNEKYLITTFKTIENEVNPMDFIQKLLFYRTVFDRFIIKSSNDEKAEDNFRWSLERPTKYEGLDYINTFENQAEQERAIKALSMLQVTFRTRIYKNWLQDVLAWFSDKNELNEVKVNDFQQMLDRWILKYYNDNKNNDKKSFNDLLKIDNETNYYSQGTSTPHFLFNFIDYLYWVESKSKKNNTTNIDSIVDFDFKYRNSVEHHLPQSFKNEENKDFIDNLGNLCLVSKSANSRMNNEDPAGKASQTGKYYKKDLPPKQKTMYDLTNTNSKWGKEEIKQHYKDVVQMLEKRNDIFTRNS